MKSRLLLAVAVLTAATTAAAQMRSPTPRPDPRIGLRAGWFNAGTANWNMRLVSTTPPSPQFINRDTAGDFRFINSDLSIRGNYVIQGNFNGVQIWDISNPKIPKLYKAFVCPGSQSDVSVYRNFLFVSGEALNGRSDCGTQGVTDTVSHERLRGIRIFDATDLANPKHVTDVQTCRGSHTHTVVTQPNDTDNVYIYVSGSAPVRSPNELAGCAVGAVDSTPNTALFRIEVIQVPLAHPEQAHIVSSPRIFQDLVAPPRHGEAPEDVAEQKREVDSTRAAGGYVVTFEGRDLILGPQFVTAAAPGHRPPPTPPRCAPTPRTSSRNALKGIVAVRASIPMPGQPSATISRSIRRLGWRAALAAGTACCSTSAMPRTPSGSAPWPTPTSRSGTRPRSTTTDRRCCSPTSGAAVSSPAAV